jgi:hypothetical protein
MSLGFDGLMFNDNPFKPNVLMAVRDEDEERKKRVTIMDSYMSFLGDTNEGFHFLPRHSQGPRHLGRSVVEAPVDIGLRFQ